ncbi:MAG: hypothetical protein RL459_654, partial [Pseudomonadota bacterium]
RLPASAWVVVATQGRRDVQGLKTALALQPQGLWFVASARKDRVILDSLLASGEDAEAVSRIVAPAGEFIGAQTPEEIALSVLTSVVAARRGRMPQPSKPVVAQDAVQAAPLTAVAPVASCCGGGDGGAIAPTAVADPVVAAPVNSSCCGG